MTAEVTSLARRMVSDGGYKEEGEGPKTELVTRDLLGSGPAAAASAEVDLELRVPVAWDERLSPHPSAKAHVQERRLTPAPHRLHDLNLSPPSLSAATLGPTPPPPPVVSAAPVVYHSACTLEKVKSALERESRLVAMSRPSPLLPNRPDGSLSPPSSSSSSSTSSLAAAAAAAAAAATTSSSAKRRASEEDDGDEGGAGTAGRVMAVAACPECLLYVLVCKVDPRCPRCAAHVPINDLRKRPRIDLNFSLQSGSNRIDNDDSTKD